MTDTTQTAITSRGWTSGDTPESLRLMKRGRDLGVEWLASQVAEDGTPAGADVANSWWRAPWALVVGGAPEVASRMLGWIEREALLDDGSLRPGAFDAPPQTTPVYHLSPIAIAAWLTGRYDTANAVMDAMMHWTDAQSGGVFDKRPFDDDPVQDTLKTSQLGLSALVTGRKETADAVADWLVRTYHDQPELPGRYYSSRRHGALVTDFPEKDSFSRVLDFDKTHQPYFQPGIAAAFLAGHHQQTGSDTSLEVARGFLDITMSGGDLQFDDPTTVQICKFGWGAAIVYSATSDPALRPWVSRMGDWFVSRQKLDGSWAPSAYATPQPGHLDYYWKTAEHVMELSYIVMSLSSDG